MIYGLAFLGYKKLSAQDQRKAILQFAGQHKFAIDEFVSFSNNPNILMFKPGDTVVCYLWSCLCKEMSFLRVFFQHIIKNGICLYSTTSKYYIDETMNMNAFKHAIAKKMKVSAPTIKRFLTTEN